jgi:CheY-like chemotaxis protein
VKDYREVPAVRANESRLGQVFLNLIVNAAQATPEGRAERNEIRIRIAPWDGGRVAVEVRDTGTGIDPAHLPRIFDAFFTTKPVGVGTGLGLAICHRIVTSLGGEIEVRSELGIGTTVRVLLPVAVHPELEEPVVARPSLTPVRRGRILIVDDDSAMCSAIRRTLSGHEVVAVTLAREALERVASGEQFDVVMSDLMMPHMTGMDLHAELSHIAPEVADRMVFMTGGAFTPGAREFLDRVPNPRLDKPFEPGTLRALVQTLMR